jgi:hypothetical protein
MVKGTLDVKRLRWWWDGAWDEGEGVVGVMAVVLGIWV